MRIGVSVTCNKCHRYKAPHGRSVPNITYQCWCTNDQCTDYHNDPKPGCLWPNEDQFDFGFEFCLNATKEVPDTRLGEQDAYSVV